MLLKIEGDLYIDCRRIAFHADGEVRLWSGEHQYTVRRGPKVAALRAALDAQAVDLVVTFPAAAAAPREVA